MWKARETSVDKYKIQFITTLETDDINVTHIHNLCLDRLFLGSAPGKMLAIFKFDSTEDIEHVMHIDISKEKFIGTTYRTSHKSTAYYIKCHDPFHQQWVIETE